MHANTTTRILRYGLAITLLIVSTFALAAPLEGARIEAYIASLAAVRELGDELRAQGKEDFLAAQILPGKGETFDPHRRAVAALRAEDPVWLERLEAAVLPQGFTSADSWAAAGDRIVLAYGAVKVEAESPQMLLLAGQGEAEQEMLLQSLPSEQRELLRQALGIARALAQVPAADRQAVRPWVGQLDQLFGAP